jgi:hypothetical protein
MVLYITVEEIIRKKLCEIMSSDRILKCNIKYNYRERVYL